jgi:hypothetical protein
VITVNVAMVAYLGWRLWRRSRPAATGRQKEGAAPS